MSEKTANISTNMRINSLLLDSGEAGGKSKKKRGKPEDDLLKWIKEITQDYEGVSIDNFKER